jgi:unsaturated chondroitin disaccharide hydrolase
MNRKTSYALLAGALLWLNLACSSTANQEQVQTTEENSSLSTTSIDTIFQEAGAQYNVMMARLPQEQFPKTYHAAEDRLETSGSEWWCSGFYPGTLLYLYDETGDQALLTEANRMLGLLEKEQYNTSTHDLGFMMYCSFGYANKLAPNPRYDSILLNSARSLATRFDPKVGAIRSWDSDARDYLVIIDNMMNLELLFWATRFTGDSSFHKIATTHANTTLQHHFRPDNSSYHVINYDPATGAIQQKRTAQGAADESAWARGQAWGLYGYTATYRETKDPRYLEQAKKIADFMLNHPNLPADKIPYWDYNAPGIPNALRDASAGAIMASALLELSQLVEDQALSQSYRETAETVLQTLSTETYKAAPGTNGGFILKHGVGHLPQGTEVDVPLTYADYYYIEGLKRYKELGRL